MCKKSSVASNNFKMDFIDPGRNDTGMIIQSRNTDQLADGGVGGLTQPGQDPTSKTNNNKTAFSNQLLRSARFAANQKINRGFVFVDDQAVRYSLAVTAAVVCPLGALVVKTCLRPYVDAVDETRLREAGEAGPVEA